MAKILFWSCFFRTKMSSVWTHSTASLQRTEIDAKDSSITRYVQESNERRLLRTEIPYNTWNSYDANCFWCFYIFYFVSCLNNMQIDIICYMYFSNFKTGFFRIQNSTIQEKINFHPLHYKVRDLYICFDCCLMCK